METGLIGSLELLGAGDDRADALTRKLSFHKVISIATGACTVMKHNPYVDNKQKQANLTNLLGQKLKSEVLCISQDSQFIK